jgi:hypothetical protein
MRLWLWGCHGLLAQKVLGVNGCWRAAAAAVASAPGPPAEPHTHPRAAPPPCLPARSGLDGTYKLGDFGMATLKHGHWHVEEGDAR